MRQLEYTIFITNNRASRQLWGKENLVKHIEMIEMIVASNSNTSKTLKVNIASKRVFDKLSNDIQVDGLCTCASLIIDI